MRATLDEQARAGNIDAETSGELTRKRHDIDRALADNKPDKAAEKVANLRKKIDDLREDDKMSGAGYDAVTASLDQLAATLPATKRDEKD